MNLLPIGQTTQTSCPGCPNPLPSVSSSSPATPCFASIFFFFPKTATTPTQQHHEDAASRGTICYLPPSTAPKMKIIDSGNGGFLQPSLFLKAFERVLDSQVCFKSSRVFFFKFS